MAQLLNFTENDLLGSVTHVDTEQIIIEIENPLIMGQICVGNLVAIETGKHHELLISLIDKVTRKYVDDFTDNEEDVDEIMISSADYVKVSVIGTYHSVLGNAHDIFKRGVDTFPQIESKCYCISSVNLQSFMNILSRNIDSDKRTGFGQSGILQCGACGRNLFIPYLLPHYATNDFANDLLSGHHRIYRCV